MALLLKEITKWLLSVKDIVDIVEYQNGLDKVKIEISSLTETCLDNVLIWLYLGDNLYEFLSGRAKNILKINIDRNGNVSHSWIDEELGPLHIPVKKEVRIVSLFISFFPLCHPLPLPLPHLIFSLSLSAQSFSFSLTVSFSFSSPLLSLTVSLLISPSIPPLSLALSLLL